MRESIQHADETGRSMDIDAIADEGLKSTKSMHAELSGAYLRWEFQMSNAVKQSIKLEEEFALLRPHILASGDGTASEQKSSENIQADSFSTDEHRDFLSRCLRSIRGDA